MYIYTYNVSGPGASALRTAAVPCNVPGPATTTLLAPATFLSLPRQRPWPLQRLLVPVQRHKSSGPSLRSGPLRCASELRGASRSFAELRAFACSGPLPLLQGPWTLQQVLLEPQNAPARLLDAATRAAGATGRSCNPATGAAGATGRCCTAGGRCNRCCRSHRTLQGCWMLQQVLLEPHDAPALLLDAATGAAEATGRSSKVARRCNRCCWNHTTLLQGCWTLRQVLPSLLQDCWTQQQVLLEPQYAPASLLDAATDAASAA